MEEETVVVAEAINDDASNVIVFPTKGKKTPPKRIPSSAVIPNTPVYSGPEINEGDAGVTTADEHDEEKRRTMADTICSGIMAEVYFKLANMGYAVHSEQFEKDLEFAQEALHSAILRTYDIFHPVQEFVDENFELVAIEDLDPGLLPVPPTANT